MLVQAQALCDQMGQLLHRARTQRQAESANAHAQGQAVRNALLAAISHDYRTPLAAIMGAASSLRDQGGKLAPAQRERLADSIVAETHQLSRLTDNTLQLVRLDAPGVKLKLDLGVARRTGGLGHRAGAPARPGAPPQGVARTRPAAGALRRRPVLPDA